MSQSEARLISGVSWTLRSLAGHEKIRKSSWRSLSKETNSCSEQHAAGKKLAQISCIQNWLGVLYSTKRELFQLEIVIQYREIF
jgi:hypothetical protein